MDYIRIPSPIGILTVAATENGIAALHIKGDKHFTSVPEEWNLRAKNPHLVQTRRELGEYFEGNRMEFTVPLAVSGTSFQKKVWNALRTVAPGTLTTYGNIARDIGRPTALRAVGSAIGRNPVCIMVPCHRVASDDGSPGGFVAGIGRKVRSLSGEGVVL